MNKKFKEVTAKNMLAVECPDCNSSFGITMEFLDKVGELTFMYHCPYCGFKHRFDAEDFYASTYLASLSEV